MRTKKQQQNRALWKLKYDIWKLMYNAELKHYALLTGFKLNFAEKYFGQSSDYRNMKRRYNRFIKNKLKDFA